MPCKARQEPKPADTGFLEVTNRFDIGASLLSAGPSGRHRSTALMVTLESEDEERTRGGWLNRNTIKATKVSYSKQLEKVKLQNTTHTNNDDKKKKR